MGGGAKPKGISLHVGLNQVDSIHYTGWKGWLPAKVMLATWRQ